MILCRFCQLAGKDTPAAYLMPQDERIQDERIGFDAYLMRWLPCCLEHSVNWYNDLNSDRQMPQFSVKDGRIL